MILEEEAGASQDISCRGLFSLQVRTSEPRKLLETQTASKTTNKKKNMGE